MSLVTVVKWLATASSLILVVLNSYDITPYDRWAGLLAASLWMWVGFLWRESAMWIPNLVFAVIYITGLLR